MQTGLKILVVSQAQQVELDEFHHPTVGTPTAVKLQEQGANEGEVNFNGYPAGRFRQPVATAQDAFDPAEEELDVPALAIKSGHQFGGHVLVLGLSPAGAPPWESAPRPPARGCYGNAPCSQARSSLTQDARLAISLAELNLFEHLDGGLFA